MGGSVHNLASYLWEWQAERGSDSFPLDCTTQGKAEAEAAAAAEPAPAK